MPWAQVGPSDIYYQEAGEGQPLVFLHGMSSCAARLLARAWRPGGPLTSAGLLGRHDTRPVLIGCRSGNSGPASMNRTDVVVRTYITVSGLTVTLSACTG